MKDNKDYSVIFVNPVQRKSAQGRDLQSYMILDPKTGEIIPGQRKNKNREDNVGATYGFLVDFNKRKLVTGLDKLVPNEFFGRDPVDIIQENNLDHNKWENILEKIVTKDDIKLQTYYEILAGVDPGLYTDDLRGPLFIGGSRIGKNSDAPNYLQTFSITLYPRPNRFTDETPRSRLAIQLLKNNPKIAGGIDQVNPSLHDFYISEENEAERTKNRKKKLIKEAYYRLMKLEQELTAFKVYQVAILCKNKHGDPIIKGDVSQERIESALNAYISEDSPDYEYNIKNFLEIAKLVDTKPGVLKLDIMYLIQQAINKDIIVGRDGYYLWHKYADKENVGKFTSHDKLVSFFTTEYKNYIPQDTDVTNWYRELVEELKKRGARIE